MCCVSIKFNSARPKRVDGAERPRRARVPAPHANGTGNHSVAQRHGFPVKRLYTRPIPLGQGTRRTRRQKTEPWKHFPPSGEDKTAYAYHMHNMVRIRRSTVYAIAEIVEDFSFLSSPASSIYLPKTGGQSIPNSCHAVTYVLPNAAKNPRWINKSTQTGRARKNEKTPLLR